MSRPPVGAPWPAASTRLVALLGWPVRHSLSPIMHNAAFAEQALDLAYLALPVRPEDLDEVIAALGAAGAVGANVTVPHKRAALGCCEHLTDEAELIGAVNTLVWTTDGLLGDNTDAAGLREALRAEVDLHDGEVAVVLGTGGAARASVVALGRLDVEVVVVGRRADAAAELATLAQRAGAPAARAVDLADTDDVEAAIRSARLVVNATPLGLEGEPLPDPFHRLGPGQVAYDLIYHPPVTPFLAAARAAGAEGHHGLGMLVGQAAAAYRRWTGQAPPVATMSAAAMRALTAP